MDISNILKRMIIMQKYVGSETVQATPMTRGAYNIERGWTIPDNENPFDDGYLVERENHTNWIPKDVFEKTYHESYDIEMLEVKHDLLTSNHTQLMHEKNFQYNAPHIYQVFSVSEPDKVLGGVHFQEGPIKEVGVNGVCNEDVISMVINRLEHFQRSEYSSRDNQMAIGKLEEAMLWLRKRTIGRENRGVEGTNAV